MCASGRERLIDYVQRLGLFPRKIEEMWDVTVICSGYTGSVNCNGIVPILQR